MADTFDKVYEQRPAHSLKNKLMLIATMACLISENIKGDEQKVFLYVIQRKIDNEEGIDDVGDENWRGKLFYLTSLVKNKFQALKSEIKQMQED